LLVQEAEPLDDGGARVGNQRKSDLARLSELLQCFRGIVADGDEPKPLFADFGMTALQLDELRLAVRSPVGGPEEHEHQTLGTRRRGEAMRLTELICSSKRRKPVADLRTDRGRVDLLWRLSGRGDETRQRQQEG